MGWAFPTLAVTLLAIVCRHAQCAARLGDERIIFQTRFGNLELALYPEARSFQHCSQAPLLPLPQVAGRCLSLRIYPILWNKSELVPLQVAPVTARHILKLAKMGAYNTVNFFRVDQGFVAQTADVVYGRLESCPLDARQMVCLTCLRSTQQPCPCCLRGPVPICWNDKGRQDASGQLCTLVTLHSSSNASRDQSVALLAGDHSNSVVCRRKERRQCHWRSRRTSFTTGEASSRWGGTATLIPAGRPSQSCWALLLIWTSNTLSLGALSDMSLIGTSARSCIATSRP